MTRMLAFVAALLMSAIAVSSACVATSVTPLQFTIEPTSRAVQQGDALPSPYRLIQIRAVSRDIRR